MVRFTLFVDVLRQEEIETFYSICQKHRDYYRGYPKNDHPLTYFHESEFMWQCPQQMSHVYLRFPPYHMRYKQPVILPPTTGRTSGLPQLPDRSLRGRFNKPPCKAFIR